jgi:hypothetical protein
MRAGAIILVLGILAGVAFWSWQPNKGQFTSWQQGEVVRSTPTGLWRLQWGYEDGQVRYLAFMRGDGGEPPSLISVGGPMPGGKIVLSKPNQPPEEIPAEFNVFELIDGHFEQQHIPLTIEQAKAYCDAVRDSYTISTLRDFLNSNGLR